MAQTTIQISQLPALTTGLATTDEILVSDAGVVKRMDISVWSAATETFTNKTFDADATGNNLTNIEVANLKSGVLDIDLASVSGNDDTLASAKAIKTYVDAQGTSPGGSNTHVQYQSGGGFAGSANLIFDGTDTLTLSSTSTPELVINSPSGSQGVNLVMSCASGTTGSLLTRYKEGAANGTTNNMAYFLGYETGDNVFSLRSLNSDGGQTSAVVWQCHDGTGAITKPLQPSFIAKLTTAQNNVLGGSGGGALLDLRVANSNWSIIEERDECFNNGTFTAPVTGLYLVHCFIQLGGLSSANTYSNLWLECFILFR